MSLQSLRQLALGDVDRLAKLPDDAPLTEPRRQAVERLLSALQARESVQQTAAPSSGGAAAGNSPATRLDGPPPFSVLSVDRLRDQRDSMLAQRSALQSALKSIDNRLESAAGTRRKAEEAVRLARESLEGGTPSDGVELQRARLDLAGLELRAEEQELAAAADSRTTTQQRLAQIGQVLGVLDAELARAGSALKLGEEEMDVVERRLREAQTTLVRERRTALLRLARVPKASSGAASEGGASAAEWSAVLTGLAELEGVYREQRAIWQLRKSVLSSPADRDAALAKRLEQEIGRLHARLEVVEPQVDAAGAALQGEHSNAAIASAGSPARDDEASAREAKVRLLRVQWLLRDTLRESLTLARRTREESSVSARPASAWGWLGLAGTTVAEWARAAWDLELFAASDSVQVDGRTVTVSRGVTVGKSVGMLLIVALGYWISRGVTRGTVGLLVRRSVLKPQSARGTQRWLMWVLMLCVIVTALRLAHIPVTAFAFLGGALALGFGFGAQTLLKNFISGVIMLFERKIRVGDVLTVGGVSGTVSSIDLRATTLHGSDGIETVVPNSMLLEGQVSNWSLGSPTVRRSIGVAVPHGTNLRQVLAMLVECAASQEGALADPPPSVLLEDFSGPTVVIRLQYWYRLGSTLSSAEVDSQLRLRVIDRLTSAGIKLPAT